MRAMTAGSFRTITQPTIRSEKESSRYQERRDVMLFTEACSDQMTGDVKKHSSIDMLLAVW